MMFCIIPPIATPLVERFFRRVSRNSTIEDEPTRVENILGQNNTTPQRSIASRLPSPENIRMTALRMESTETLESPTQRRVNFFSWNLLNHLYSEQ